jgi:hypothetical protein
MQITISVHGRSFIRNLGDLTKAQDTALGEFLGRNALRDEAFDHPWLNRQERFEPVTAAEVRATCPYQNKFKVKFHADDVTKDAPLEVAPGYSARTRSHTGSGYCRVCGVEHRVVRPGLLVSTTVEGLPFSREYQ